MKYIVTVQDTTTGNAEPLVMTDNWAVVERVRLAFSTVAEGEPVEPRTVPRVMPSRPGRPARAVVVVQSTVDTFPVGHEFRTALDASFALGYTFNAFTQGLSLARRRGLDTVTLRGVTLAHKD
jgi:hypothetical protein